MARLRHKIGLALALLLAGSLLVVMTLPAWVLAPVRPVLSRYGVTYKATETKGAGQFALTDVRYRAGEVEVTARTVRGFAPYVWVWHRLVSPAPVAFVQVEDWTLRVSPAAPEPRALPGAQGVPVASDPASPVSVVQDTRQALARISRWIPRAELRRGTIQLPSGEIILPAVHWDARQLSAEVGIPALHEKVVLTLHNARTDPKAAAGSSDAKASARLGSASPWELTLASEPSKIGLHLTVRQEAASVHLQGTAEWMTNQLALAAVFTQAGWLPQVASVQAQEFRIPTTSLGLAGFQDVSGSVQAHWTNGQFQVDLRAQGQPEAGQNLFPVEVLLQASGDINSLQVAQARVQTPWLTAEVSPGVRLDYAGKLLSGEAKVEVSAELAKQPWFPATGTVAGLVVLRSGLTGVPDATFNLAGTNLQSAGIRSGSVEMKGTLSWPWLQIDQAEARFEEGGSAVLAARADLLTRSITNAVLHVEGNFGRLFLPANSVYETVRLHADLRGPIEHLNHQGVVEVKGFTDGRFVPLDFVLQWKGQQKDLDAFEGRMATAKGEAALLFRGSAQGEGTTAGLRFDQFTLLRTNQTVYTLVQPFAVSLDRDHPPNDAREWLLALQPFHWRGEERELFVEANLAWPLQGAFQCRVENGDTSVFGGFLQRPPPAFNLDHINFAGMWSNGPASFSLDLATHFTGPRQVPVAARVLAHSDGHTISVTQFEVASAAEQVIVGHGSLPLRFQPGRPGHRMELDENQPLELSARTVPNTQFWNQVSEWTRLGLAEPRVELEISGPARQPAGTVRLRVAAIDASRLWTNRALPRLEGLSADLSLDQAAVRINSLDLQVEGQRVTGNGRVPLGTNLATNWRKFFRWNEATGAIQVPEAKLAAFTRFLPKTLSAQGTLNVDLAVQPNLQTEGQVIITGAATRPLPSIGPVDDLEARLRLQGRRLEVQSLTGKLGGEKFAITGGADLAARHPETGLPLLQLAVHGNNLPLARQPGFIFRSDLDVAITSQTNGRALVSGTVRLRDSVFLSDLRVLVPGKIAQPRQRPPYFSIDVEPLADWPLNLQVKGDRFLKVRSPFFQGQVSADLKLEGTLKEPIALGEVTINSGTVQFPFANLQVTQGLVALTSADPYRPQLFVAAGARALGYDVKMEVSGKADAPVIQFNSTPPLSSEQVVFMLTAGELPRQENSVSAQQRAGRLALFLGKNLLSEFSPGQGGADRLTIRSGEYISEQGKQTYSVEYRLSKDWSIVGEYDRFGAFNADLKWRLYSR